MSPQAWPGPSQPALRHAFLPFHLDLEPGQGTVPLGCEGLKAKVRGPASPSHVPNTPALAASQALGQRLQEFSWEGGGSWRALWPTIHGNFPLKAGWQRWSPPAPCPGCFLRSWVPQTHSTDLPWVGAGGGCTARNISLLCLLLLDLWSRIALSG